MIKDGKEEWKEKQPKHQSILEEVKETLFFN